MLHKKYILLIILLFLSFSVMSCQVTTTTTTTSGTTSSSTTTTSQSTTSGTATSQNPSTETTTSTVTTTTTTPVVSNSPLPVNDTRPTSEFANGSIIVDNSNREFTYRNARLMTDSIDETTYGNSYVDNNRSSRFVGSYHPTIQASGYYKIYINFPTLPNPSDAVVLQIDYEGGANIDYTKTLDQTINAGYWVMIGTYFLTSGTNNAVHIFGANGFDVAADAVLFDLSVAVSTMQAEDPLELRSPKAPGSVANILMTRDFKFRYSVDGEIFFMKGVAGVDELELMAEAGANSARTYSVDALRNGDLLDEAHSHGIKIVIGLWMDHESGSFTYHDNPSHVQEQYLELIAAVEKYKTHPAVLAWAVGNEVDISTSKNPIAIYNAINAIAKYIHESDPYHPTMAVLAGSSTVKIGNIARYSPHIDIIGINTYKSIANVATNIISWQGPYAITEFAMNQPSETTLRTSWGAIIEPSSMEKADLYYSRYQSYILGKSDQGCIGSYVFKDSGSFRITHTWYGIVYDGLRTPAFYAMKSAWTETDRVSSLAISNVTIDGKNVLNNVSIPVGMTRDVVVTIQNPNLGNLTYRYEIKKEVTISTNSIPAARTDFVIITSEIPGNVTLTVPQETGGFRLFVYVSSDLGEVSTESFPFQVTSSLSQIIPETNPAMSNLSHFIFDDAMRLYFIKPWWSMKGINASIIHQND
jgi:hypothetical protein